ncbi:MAG: lytic murein transglycosylase [Parvularculaceae bacterium]
MRRRISLLAGAAIFAASAPLAGVLAQSGPEADDNSRFAAWLEEFRAEAARSGVGEATLRDAFSGITLNPRVIAANNRQPEFTRPIWEYLEIAVSPERVERGRAGFAEHRDLLAEIESAYSVDAEAIAAIWGLESSYGAIMGDYDAFEALATLAFEGRRTSYGREQLLGALKILDMGYASKDLMKGSWAGAMGQTQFIPTTYLAYAQDHDGDGRRDLWTNLGDVFASTANYLKVSGWRLGEPAAVEVSLPADFDYALADLRIRKPLSEWRAIGVAAIAPDRLATLGEDAEAAILLPAGARGPAFFTFQNFRAFMRYNNSSAYALGVAGLSELIAGEDWSVSASWPVEERPLNREQRIALQRYLAESGYEPGAADGIIGARTKAALRAYQRDVGLAPDGFATTAVLRRLEGVIER